MLKRIIWLIILLLIISVIGYIKFYLPNSQWQLREVFKKVDNLPINIYFSANEKNCGVWYEQSNGEIVEKSGRSNKGTKACFEKYYNSCQPAKILLVSDANIGSTHTTVYSLIRVIRKNDQNECLIQNYFEKQNFDITQENSNPISYINTCTELADNYFSSCEPQYIKDLTEKQK